MADYLDLEHLEIEDEEGNTEYYKIKDSEALHGNITDAEEATAINNDDENIITARAVYHGTPTINNNHDYTSDTNYYAAETVGEQGQFMVSTGEGAPTWEDPEDITVEHAESAETDSEGNVINETYVSNVSLSVTLSGYVSVDGDQNLTNKTYEGYTLADACSYEVTDNEEPTAVSSTDHNLVTGETVYNTLPMFNDNHDYTADSDYFVAEEAGTAGQVLESTSATPVWVDQSTLQAGSAIYDSEGNNIANYYISTNDADEKIKEAVEDAVSDIEGTLSDDYVTLNGEQAITNKTYEGYTLAPSCAMNYIDAVVPTTIDSDGERLTTERKIYHGLPTINGAHDYTNSSTYFAPVGGGTANQVLISNGNSSAPTWTDQSNIAAGSATYDSAGNNISSTYMTNEYIYGAINQAVSSAIADVEEEVQNITESLDNDYVTLTGQQSITNKTYNGYTLGSASEYSVTDNQRATSVSNNDTNLVTARTVYHGTPTVNNSHSYTDNTSIYAPTSGGTTDYLLTSTGSTGTPTWSNPDNITVGKATADANGNDIASTYATQETVDDMIGDITGFDAEVVDELPSEGEKGIIYLIPHNHGENDTYDEYIWISNSSTWEKIGNTDIDLDNYVTVDGHQDLTNKTYEGYSLNNAVEYDVTDNNEPTAISTTATKLPTERSIYYGLPYINDSHDYTSSDKIYAPIEAGTNGYVLQSTGNSTPEWVDPDTVTAKHIDVNVTDDTTNSISPDFGESFEVVDSVTRDEYGHVTSINTSTVTLPEENTGIGGVGCYAESESTSTFVKTATVDNFSLQAGAFAAITFSTEVEGGATLNINNTGAKEIYQMGSPIKDDVIQAGATAMFVYTGTYYYLLCCDSDAGGDYIDESGGGLTLKPLAECSVSDIRKIAQSGLAEECWNIGDTYPITLNGTVGAYEFDNETWNATIIGFDHNKDIETGGLSSVTFQFGVTDDGVEIAFCDSNYGSSTTNGFCMNTSNTNSGGWESSYMRNTICPEFLEAMSDEWQAIIKPTIKYTDNVGGGNGNVESNVTATEDKIFLLALHETGATSSTSNSYEDEYIEAYSDYYTSSSERVRHKHSDPESTCNWRTRSCARSSSSNFIYVTSSGNGSSASTNSYGFAPAFTIF